MRWKRIQKLFHEALEVPREQREVFLRNACGDDAEAIAEVLALLESDQEGIMLLDAGLPEAADRLLPPQPVLPRQIGPYRTLRLLGEGGMGVVYLAEREDLAARVAIKLLRDAALSPARRARFAHEERILAQFNHPAIARLYDADVLPDGTPYFVMEYVEGIPITEYCATHGCSIHERLVLFQAVCEAVQYAHRHAIVHRDLKPSNILVERDGGTGRPAVKLLDFGIAKRLENDGAPADQTQTALRLMTPAYAAPEQLRGEPVGVHSDVYALGAILYELLTGQHRFEIDGLAPGEVERLVLEQEPEKPSSKIRRNGSREDSLGRAAWADLDTLCLTALHKDPQLRYSTVEALMRDLQNFRAGEPLEARPSTWRYRMGKFVARHRRSIAVAATLAVGAMALTAMYTARLADARDTALAEAARTERIQQFMLGLFEGGDPVAGPADSLRVVTLLDRGVREAHALEAEPAVQAELYQTLGTLYQQLGDFGRADSLLQHALARRRSVFGPATGEVAQSLLALGRLRTAQAEFDEAEHLVQEALVASQRHLPAGHPAIAEATEELGRVLTKRGEYDRAVTLLEEAVRLRAAGGSEGAEASRSLTALANAHFYAGRYATSDSLNRMVLALERRLYGRRHPHVASTLISLGATRTQLGFYAEAEQLKRQALAITLGFYGPDHPKTAANLVALSQALTPQNRYSEALEVLESARAIRERVYGADHPRLAIVLNQMGTVALQQGDPPTAESYYHRAIDVYRAAHGEGHYFVGVGLSNLASAYYRDQRYPQAEDALRQAVAIFAEALGKDHLHTAIANVKLGGLLVELDRHAEAEASLLAGYDVLAAEANPAGVWIQSARAELAAVYETLGDGERAERFREEHEEVAG